MIRANKQLSTVTGKKRVVGKWVHLAGVLTDDRKLQLYVNGELAGTADGTGFITSDPSQAMEIGADGRSAVGEYKSPFGFTGLIDEVRVYRRTLSAEEIKQHASAGQGAPEKGEALALYYSFDQGDAADDSGNGNKGVVVGATPAPGKIGKAMKFAAKKGRSLPFTIKHNWSQALPIHPRAMVRADKTLFIAGPPALIDEEESFEKFAEKETQEKLTEQRAAFEGRKGAALLAVSPTDGKTLAKYELDAAPVWDGMAAAKGRLYFTTTDGRVICMAKK